MTPKERLTNVFEEISQVYVELGERYHDENVDRLVGELRTGGFFKLSEKSQMSILDWFDKALLGRGEGLYGILDAGLLPPDFPDQFRLAIMMYYLSLQSVEDEAKDWLRKRIAEILNK